MRKWIAVFAAVMLTLCAGACGGESEEIILFRGLPDSMQAEAGDFVSVTGAGSDGITVSVNDPSGRAVPISEGGFTAQSVGKYRIEYSTENAAGETFTHTVPLDVKKKTERVAFSVADGFVSKREGKAFRILLIADVQIVDPDLKDMTAADYDAQGLSALQRAKYRGKLESFALRYVRQLVAETDPDFIVLLGDNVYGQFDDGTNFRKLVDLVDSYGIPWGYVNGNHDGEQVKVGWGLANQCDYAANQTENCFFVQGEIGLAGSYGNYAVRILENGKDFYTLYFLDTHSNSVEDSVSGGAGIYGQQVAWYSESVRDLSDRNGRTVPSLVFFHIPLKEFGLAMEQYAPGGGGIGKVTENDHGDYGENMSGSGELRDEGLWSAIRSFNSTRGVFCGHQHTNNSSILYEGIRLTYGVKTGLYDGISAASIGGTLATLSPDGSLSVVPYLIGE